MDLKKVIVAGVPAGVVLFVLASVMGAFTFQFALDWGITDILKPLGEEFFFKGFVFYMAIGFILSGAYNIFSRAMPLPGVNKGLKFGVILWILSMIPGMGIVFFTLALPDKLIASWLAMAFIEYVIACGLIGVIQERL
jgi:hypothetical protein